MIRIIKAFYDFSAEKNYQLIDERGICFEEIILALDQGKLLDIIEHRDQIKYPGQHIYILNINDYVYMVPYIRKDEFTVFLKTIIPSRKMTKKYLGGKHD